ncbi:hypothetical protein F5B20DRAFT_586772 [Whalleya microplaca]|nr:hypothetical protein F5B20DRAFT_586772 [Whalleya microplaca]
MHFLSATPLPSTLLPLLLLSRWTLAGATGVQSACLRDGARNLSEAAACGDKGSLEYCFLTASGGFIESNKLQQCFYHAGCTLAESVIEADFVIKNCGNGKSAAELRRRGPDRIPALTAAPVPRATTATTEATTTAATTGTTGTSTSLICSTTSTMSTSSCPIQSTGSESGSTLSCFETTVPTEVCADENICMKDSKGLDVCMLRKDTLDTGELVITIILAVCFGVGTATLFFLCCRDKRNIRKRQAQKEAQKIAKSAAANKEIPAPMQRPPTSPGAGAAPAQNPFA